MVPIMKLTAENRPSSLLGFTLEGLLASIFVGQLKIDKLVYIVSQSEDHF